MARKQQRALFELLVTGREEDQARQMLETTRPPTQPAVGQEAAPPGETGPERVPAWGGRLEPRGGLSPAYYYWALGLIAAGCLCAVVYFLVMRFRGGPAIPPDEGGPTFGDVRRGPVDEGLVRPSPPPPPPSEEGTGDEAAQGTGGEGEKAPEGRYRVRIARLDVARSEYTDRLRAFLADQGVETALEGRGGYYFLYSRARFASDTGPEIAAFLAGVNSALEQFEQVTGWPATTNPYVVPTR